MGHWFWWMLTAMCLAWYSVITVYVGIKGWFDIKSMLSSLHDEADLGEAGDE